MDDQTIDDIEQCDHCEAPFEVLAQWNNPSGVIHQLCAKHLDDSSTWGTAPLRVWGVGDAQPVS